MDRIDLQGLDEIYGAIGTGPIPTAPMTSPSMFDQEMERIFKSVWLKVCRVEEIAEPNDYLVRQLEFARTSAIIIRGKDGKVRAYHNICPHRGNKVIPEDGPVTTGRARGGSLSCRFHGWVFGSSGELRMIPQEGRFPQAPERACLGLKPIHCDVWEGFVFIHLGAEPREDLMTFLGGIAHHFASYPFHEASFSRRYSTVLKCNWKVALYAFSEAYHVETIHAGTLPGIASVTTEQADFRTFGPHITSTYYVPGAGEMKPTKVSERLAQVLHVSPAHAPRLADLPPSVNPTKRQDFMFEFPVLFPNVVLHLCAGAAYPGMSHFDHVFWPIDHEHTLWEGTNYYRPPTKPSELVAITHTDALHRNAWLEDTSTMEDTHSALMSGILENLILMDEEVMIRHTDLSVVRTFGAICGVD